MKRAILILFLCIWLAAAGSAQTLTITPADNPVITKWFPDSVTMKQTLGIKNNSGVPVYIKIRRIDSLLVQGHIPSFWVGNTRYSSSTTEMSDSILLKPNDSPITFSSELNPVGIAGTSLVTYEISIVGNTETPVRETFTYQIKGNSTGIEKSNPTTELLALHLYPNPATETARIDYRLNQTVSNGNLKIYDMLGNEVKNFPVKQAQGSQNVDVSSFTPGIYFASIIIQNKSVLTRRFVVAR